MICVSVSVSPLLHNTITLPLVSGITVRS